MTTLPNLHDGFFDGLWISEDKNTRFFVRTLAGERSTIILTGVEALNVWGLRAGNILFDLVLIPTDKLTLSAIEQAYDLNDQGEMARQLLSKAQQAGLSAVEINPSYGAEGKALFRNLAAVSGHVLP